VTAAASPHAQVAAALVPLRISGDGQYRLVVHLHPLELGPVSVSARVADGTVSVELAGGSDAAHDALAAALPELHRELRGEGFTSVAVAMGSMTATAGDGSRGNQQPAASSSPGQGTGHGSGQGAGSSDPGSSGRRAPFGLLSAAGAQRVGGGLVDDGSLDRWL
jgi:flagellar hook-length control protein FliK